MQNLSTPLEPPSYGLKLHKELNLDNRLTFRLLAHKAHLILKQWHHNHRTRQHLKDLPPSLLRDIGISSGQVTDECQKRFWQD